MGRIVKESNSNFPLGVRVTLEDIGPQTLKRLSSITGSVDQRLL